MKLIDKVAVPEFQINDGRNKTGSLKRYIRNIRNGLGIGACKTTDVITFSIKIYEARKKHGINVFVYEVPDMTVRYFVRKTALGEYVFDTFIDNLPVCPA